MELHSRGGRGGSPQGPIPQKTKNPIKKNPGGRIPLGRGPKSPHSETRSSCVHFLLNLGLRLQTRGFCLGTFRTGEYVREIEGAGIEKIGRRVQD